MRMQHWAGAVHERLADHRVDEGWFADALARADLRAVVLTDEGLGERTGPLHDAEAAALVGRDAGGRIVVGIDATRGRNPAALDGLVDVRDVRAAVGAHPEPSVALHALSLARWHSSTRHCPRCGARLVARHAGHVLRCPTEGVDHFPRLEPAMIVVVVDDDDRVLLGRQRVWPAHMFSCLAGFVEPGETVEDACRREVAEESGVRVTDVDYVGSQPWPFPASLMIGLRARAATTAITLTDELADARWFSRSELADAMTRGAVVVPPALSIAHRLIARWYGSTGTPLRVVG